MGWFKKRKNVNRSNPTGTVSSRQEYTLRILRWNFSETLRETFFGSTVSGISQPNVTNNIERVMWKSFIF